MAGAGRRGQATAWAGALAAGVLLVGTAGVAPARAAISGQLIVTTLADTAATDGVCSLREAITAANTNTGGAIAGECPPGTTETDPITFAVSGVIELASDLPAITSAVTIDGGGTGAVIVDGMSARRPFNVSADGALALSNLSIRRGHAADDGGAILSAGTLTVSNVIIHASSASRGGGIASSGPLQLTDVTVTDSAASTAGGGLYLLALPSTLDILRARFDGNAAPSGGALGGTGSAAIHITDSVFLGNAATGAGGAIAIPCLTFIDGTTFQDNHAADGGAIASTNRPTYVQTSRFTHNAASGAGGAISAGSELQTGRSTFDANTAGTQGGAIDASWRFEIYSGTFYGNAAPSGGAIHSTHWGQHLAAMTVVGNTTTGPGAAVEISGGGGGVINDLIAGNVGGDLLDTGVDDLFVANVLGVPAGLTIDDIVVPGGVRDNGGPTPTVALTPNVAANPAVDAGDSDTCTLGLGGIDQRGHPRPVGACDIGAFELDTLAPTVGAPVADVVTGRSLSGSTVPLRVTWTGHTLGASGIDSWSLARRLGTAPWTTLGASLATPSVLSSAASGATVRFRAGATNGDGTLAAPVLGPVLRVSLVQQSSAAMRWLGTWTTTTRGTPSGGSARYATRKGASVSYTFTGRNIALVAARGPKLGQARVYINGALQATVDLRGATAPRWIAWQRHFSTSATRTVKVVVLGTAGRPRFDVDAFIVLR